MKTRPVLLSLLFLILIGIVFFNKFFIKGLVPIPSDIPTGMYYPWINHNYGYPVRVPVKNPILTDAISQFWIWRNWGINNLKNHHISFWNPNSLAGYSMSPWFHTILFSPANLFYVFLNTTTAMALIVICQLIVSLVATYLLIKIFTSSNLAAIFGSISFSFSSFFIGWLTWGTISWTLAFLPLTLYFIHKIIYQKITFTTCLGLYFSLIFSLLGGHPQTFFYVLIIICIYLISYLLLNIKNYKKIIPIFTIFILCILSTTFVTIPSLQILQNSIRGTENYIQNNGLGFIPFGKILITLFAPNFFGNPATNNYWGGDFNYQEKLVWFGTTALILSVFYLFSLIKSRKTNHINLFLIFTFSLGILLSLKYPIGFLVYKFNLPLLSTSSAARAMILTAFSGSILAAFAVKNLINNSKENKFSLKWTSFIFIPFISILLITIFILKNNPFLPEFLNNLNIAIRNLIIPCGITFALITGIFIIIKHKKFTNILILVFIFLATFEGLYNGWKYTPFTDKNLYFPKTEAIMFLQDQYNSTPYPFRIEREKSELMPPNMWQAYGFSTTSGYDPILPSSYANFLSKNKIIQNHTRYIEWENKYIDDISKLGVKYFLTLKRDKNNKIDPQGSTPLWLSNKKWTNVFEEGTVVVFKNKDFKPPYFLEGEEKNNSSINLIQKTDDIWEFKVNNKKKDKLVLLENTDPNWQVFVNNQLKTIIPFENTFKSVDLETGENIVKFIYKNYLFNICLKVSILSFIVTLSLFFIFTKTKLNKLLTKL